VKLRYSAIVLIVLLLCAVALPLQAQPSWKTYSDQAYGFSIRYPASMPFDSSRDLNAVRPICDEGTIACFMYKGETGGTDFLGAGVAVNVLRGMKTLEECNTIDTGQFPVKTETINGTSFQYGETAEVAGPETSGGTAYRAFRKGICFEITAYTEWNGMWDPDDGPQFSRQKAGKIEADMNAVVHSFRFIGPAKAGSGWNVFNDECGSVFEYPEHDSVRVDVRYSRTSSESAGPGCSEHFSDGLREYTVSAKGILKDDEVDSWLKSAGYPDLTAAALQEKSGSYAVYKAGRYFYVRQGGDIFLLYVSDATHHVLSPDGDPVFSHLLGSFKVW
jgi:hypothetical protein